MRHPYEHIGAHARWDSAVAAPRPEDVDPVVSFPVRIGRDQAIVTAGSCFAQHIARYLREAGFHHLVTEPGHPLLDDEAKAAFNYGVYSARYGNVYTSRQLVQLLQRAYAEFLPDDDLWHHETGYVDPFRPTIQPGGFATPRELVADREQHLAAVRRAFEELTVFVFTLGLTECWAARSDGAVFPVAPGVSGGVYDPQRYELLNLGVEDVAGDLTAFVHGLRRVNPGAQVVLTVSPVPLFATAVDRHVLVSTTYSKAVLRVAAEQAVEALDGVSYFPAYEIVTGSFSRGAYFASDLRSVTEPGVNHVMSLFFRYATEGGLPATEGPAPSADEQAARAFADDMEELVEVLCDEELLEAGLG